MTVGRAQAQVQTQTRAGGKVAVMQAEAGGSIPCLGRGWGGVEVCISPPGSTCLFPHRGDDGRRVCNSPIRIKRPLRIPLPPPRPRLAVVVRVRFPHSGGEAAIAATGSRASTRPWRTCAPGSRARVQRSRASSSLAGMAGGARNGWSMRRRSVGMRRRYLQVPTPMPTLTGGDGEGIGGYTGAMRRRRAPRKDGGL